MKKRCVVLAAFLSISLLAYCDCAGQITVENQCVESLPNPTGIDTLAPRLSSQVRALKAPIGPFAICIPFTSQRNRPASAADCQSTMALR
jgi:hypothetical protein